MIGNYVKGLCEELAKYSNQEAAEKMSQYMRGQFRYYGLRAPEMREVTKTYINENGLPPFKDIHNVIRQLYLLEQRELHVIALSIMDHKLKKAPEIQDIELLEFMIVTKSWWDTVDHIATNQVGIYFKKFPQQIEEYVKKWIKSDHIWLKRTAILYQLKYKNETNFPLLKEIILHCTGTKEFFIDKAIGWALREYSKFDKEAVLSFVEEHKDKLSNLSQREALKWLKGKNLV